MAVLAHAIRIASLLLSPFLVTKAKQALDEMDVPAGARDFSSLGDLHAMDGVAVGAAVPLFPRLKKDEEIAWLQNLIDGVEEKK
ncbi:MAG TPA: hypothetical protein DEA32_00525 [Firmicutes bacterium]|nr:hypothetical protein [Bacillota bacterium]